MNFYMLDWGRNDMPFILLFFLKKGYILNNINCYVTGTVIGMMTTLQLILGPFPSFLILYQLVTLVHSGDSENRAFLKIIFLVNTYLFSVCDFSKFIAHCDLYCPISCSDRNNLLSTGRQFLNYSYIWHKKNGQCLEGYLWGSAKQTNIEYLEVKDGKSPLSDQ